MAMLQYIKENSVCRSKWIGNYFGDTAVRDCDICDNCLERKKRSKAIDRRALNDQVLEILRSEPMNWMEIQERFKEVTADQLKAAIDFLIGEERIVVDAEGNLRTKGS
jgi:ATP-dependent DNA helicase RecQ